MEGKNQETAAAMAGMSVRSARHWQSGPLAIGEEDGALVAHSPRTPLTGCGKGRSSRCFGARRPGG